MIGIVRVALARPYTFIVLAIAILIVGPLAAWRMPTDIFPNINVPVIVVAWQYTGLSPEQMAGRITTPYERVLTTVVNDIEHIEANSYNGLGIVKIFFHPNVDISVANAQVTAVSQTMLRAFPQGAQPPFILNYSAATVPILQLALSGKGMTEQMLADLGMFGVRARLTSVAGAAIPWPFGGRSRQVQIDLKPAELQARGLSGQDVANALAAQNLLTPAGTQKIGQFEYFIQLNNAPSDLNAIAALPIKTVKGAMVTVRDVANVRDGGAVQTNVVHVDGARSALLNVLKAGATSTLDIIGGVRSAVQAMKPSLPEGLEVKPLGDQSLFVRAAVDGVVKEGVVAAALTSLMVLLFLGNLRATFIIATSIPLSVLGAIAALSALGETLNLMTLGGLALAVGILVDEATVTIENINWHLEQGKPVEQAILDGAQQIVVPAFVSLLCICIVFVPMFFLQGVAKFLFVPMAEAVMLAMACSFVLSRTLVPTLAKYLLKPHTPHTDIHGNDRALPPGRYPWVRLQRRFEAGFEGFREGYRGLLATALGHRRVFVAGYLGLVLASFGLLPFLGQNFFPSVDAGQIQMHIRVPVGTRLEETAARFGEIQQAIRGLIPPNELGVMVDNIGLPFSSISMSYSNNGLTGTHDGILQISLQPGHKPTEDYVRAMREELPRRFPGIAFSFLPADMVSQILNFGAPAPIDLQVRGNDAAGNFAYAHKLLNRIKHIPGVADARIQQARNSPVFNVDVDRSRARYAGVTERDVANSLVVQLAGSGQVAPTYWLNPQNGVTYPIVMQTPQYELDTLEGLQSLPVTSDDSTLPQLLGGIADIRRGMTQSVVSQYDIQSLAQIYANVQDRDLGGVAQDIQKAVDESAGELPKGSSVALLGQFKTMNGAYTGLAFGLLGAIVLIYLLIVVNFQSWSDPFVIITALPAALAGIVWMLFATGTTLSVPALIGAIMCMGVATANSVLVISFARERLDQLGDATAAALEAGFVRCRPVLMTALAMIIGMVPVALGWGEGGEQNAPLGRAVIGGLVFATVSTLLFVPVIFSLVHARRGRIAGTRPLTGELHAANS
ncbi:efflux RND transporter permease subunit [Methylococcus sp. EFPC2]|uniref:efflux RND transporter permease subunit n=1 Tax=Methylococcus sp. EFPC2 TaxID=2812648 RepID=UPI0019686519|nr:efflux RND transporter permease subunit [Methylococcus sp. EFPC2]QSA96438.1 efflux RND transporter permease subunit [Methylococcus sp. EFPC2]